MMYHGYVSRSSTDLLFLKCNFATAVDSELEVDLAGVVRRLPRAIQSVIGCVLLHGGALRDRRV